VNRCAEVEALAVQWMALLKAGDAAAAIGLVSPDEATLLAGSAPSDWYPGGRATIEHVREAITASGGLPFEPAAPAGWADGDVGWFAGQVRLALPDKVIPLRMTGVAVRQEGRWRLVQVHSRRQSPTKPCSSAKRPRLRAHAELAHQQDRQARSCLLQRRPTTKFAFAGPARTRTGQRPPGGR
jgi:ketosteroid isomerase-like protein